MSVAARAEMRWGVRRQLGKLREPPCVGARASRVSTERYPISVSRMTRYAGTRA